MKHKEKVKLAIHLMTKAEVKAHVNKFDSKAWNQRHEAIQKRLPKKQEKK